jgi:hypothetical protein
VESLTGVDKYKAFIDKLYVLYSTSHKNARGLKVCANLLDIELLKIGQILNTQWVTSSFCSVLAVWNSCEALVNHFKKQRMIQHGAKCRDTHMKTYRKNYTY